MKTFANSPAPRWVRIYTGLKFAFVSLKASTPRSYLSPDPIGWMFVKALIVRSMGISARVPTPDREPVEIRLIDVAKLVLRAWG